MKNVRALQMSSVFLVYGFLLILSTLNDWSSRGHPLASWLEGKPPSGPWIVLGLAFVIFYVVSSHFAGHFFRLFHDLEVVLRQILTPLSYLQVVVLACLSGFIEEWFFRGILMERFGIVLSSVFFGLAHLIPSRRLWPWCVITALVGAVFAVLYRMSGSLLLIAIMHTAINALLLLRLNLLSPKTASLSS